jgi:hypothetical protein
MRADPQARCLRAVNKVVRPRQPLLLEPALQMFPRSQPRSARTALRFWWVYAKKNVPDRTSDPEGDSRPKEVARNMEGAGVHARREGISDGRRLESKVSVVLRPEAILLCLPALTSQVT